MQMAKDAQAERITIGLKDEGGMVDEASGNEVPNGALKEEVRDDQPAMLSPGEFVIPAYAVRYIGVERLVGLLREAKQGMEQLDDIGLTGEPNSDDAGLETAVLPSEMQEEGGMPTLAVGGMPTIKPGAVTTTALTNQPTQMSVQQFGVAPPAATQPAVAPAFAAPSPLTQQMYRPTAPIRPPAQQNVTYPQYVYSPEGGGGYGVAEYVGPNGQAIFVTTIGGKPVSKVPEGYVTRAEYTKNQEESKTTTTPPTELQRKPEDMDPGDVTEGYDSGLENDTSTTEGMANSLSALISLSENGLGMLGNLSLLGMGASAAVSKGATMALSNLVGKEGMTGKNDKGQTTFIDYSKNPKGETLTGKKAVLAAGKTFEEAAKAAKAEGYNYYSRDSESGQHIPTNVKGGTAMKGAMQITPFGKTSKAYQNDQAAKAAKAEQARQIAAGEDALSEGYDVTPGGYDVPAGAVSYEGTTVGSEAALGLGLGASASDISAAGDAGQGDSGGGGGSSGGSSGGSPSDFGGMDISLPNKGGYIGMAEGGLIKVGDKTYGPEDFGFANKGTFVTKKKTRKRKTKKGKGLALK
jgi:hypothetical protein